MPGSSHQILTDEQIVEEICKANLWTSPWYKISNFLIRFYVTFCLVPVILILEYPVSYKYILSTIIILNDLFMNKFRMNDLLEKRKFIKAYIYELNYKNNFYKKPLITILIISIIHLFINIYIEYYNVLIYFIMLYAIIGISEYNFTEKCTMHLNKLNVGAVNNSYWLEKKYPNIDKKYDRFKIAAIGGLGHGSFIGYTKTFSILYLIFFYTFYMAASVLNTSKLENYDVLMKMTTASLSLISLLFILFVSSLDIRARELARIYLKIMEENKL